MTTGLISDDTRREIARATLKTAIRSLDIAAKKLDGLEWAEAIAGLAREAERIAERMKHY